MTRRALLPTIIALVLACGPAPTPTPTTRAPTAVEPTVVEPPALPAAPVFTPGPFEVSVDDGPPRGLVAAFSLADTQGHAWATGWTEDGTRFVHCWVSDLNCKLCLSLFLDRSVMLWLGGDDCRKDSSLELKKAELAWQGVTVRDGEWAHGGELIVTVRQVVGPSDSFGTSSAILEVGTAWRDGSGESTAFREDACKDDYISIRCWSTLHAELIAPSPDGLSVAILGHTLAGSDVFTLEIIPAGRLAAAAYNQRGLDAVARDDFEAAEAAFLAAMHADPSAWTGPYELARVYARAADPRVQPALQVAVEREGGIVRTGASMDDVFDDVRSHAWFTALIGPAQ